MCFFYGRSGCARHHVLTGSQRFLLLDELPFFGFPALTDVASYYHVEQKNSNCHKQYAHADQQYRICGRLLSVDHNVFKYSAALQQSVRAAHYIQNIVDSAFALGQIKFFIIIRQVFRIFFSKHRFFLPYANFPLQKSVSVYHFIRILESNIFVPDVLRHSDPFPDPVCFHSARFQANPPSYGPPRAPDKIFSGGRPYGLFRLR